MATKLDISQLDFDGIKDNLKTFLSQQDEFTDYDFEGSGMNILLDVLAYNTHYLGYNANMLANEMYLDSADQRSSVVSLAKQVGYTPKSAQFLLKQQLMWLLIMDQWCFYYNVKRNKIYNYG